MKKLRKKPKTKFAQLQEENKRYREIGQELERVIGAIDQLVASKTDPDFDPTYPISNYDYDFDPKGVYDRIKKYVESVDDSLKYLLEGRSKVASVVHDPALSDKQALGTIVDVLDGTNDTTH